jgi:hypothetical protein
VASPRGATAEQLFQKSSQAATPSACPRGADGQNDNLPPATSHRGVVGGGNGAAPAGSRSAGGDKDDSLIEKSKEYLRCLKAKYVEELKTKLGGDILTYDAIRATRKKEQLAAIMGEDSKIAAAALDSMVEMGE